MGLSTMRKGSVLAPMAQGMKGMQFEARKTYVGNPVEPRGRACGLATIGGWRALAMGEPSRGKELMRGECGDGKREGAPSLYQPNISDIIRAYRAILVGLPC